MAIKFYNSKLDFNLVYSINNKTIGFEYYGILYSKQYPIKSKSALLKHLHSFLRIERIITRDSEINYFDKELLRLATRLNKVIKE